MITDRASLLQETLQRSSAWIRELDALGVDEHQANHLAAVGARQSAPGGEGSRPQLR